MGSVSDYIKCPNCGQPNCHSELYIKSNEYNIQCSDCGYYKSVTIKEESRKKRFDEMTKDDWETIEISNPFGAIRGKEKQNKFHFGGTISTKEHYKNVLKNFKENTYDELTISRYINGKIVVTDIIRKLKLERIKSKICTVHLK